MPCSNQSAWMWCFSTLLPLGHITVIIKPTTLLLGFLSLPFTVQHFYLSSSQKKNVSIIIVLHTSCSLLTWRQPTCPDLHPICFFRTSLYVTIPSLIPILPANLNPCSIMDILEALQLPSNAPCRVIALILMTFSIMSTWLQLLPLNLHHFHPLHCWIPLAPINFWFLLNTIKQPSAFFLNNNDNLLTLLITSCSRAMGGEKRNEHKKERQPKSKMCLSYQS